MEPTEQPESWPRLLRSVLVAVAWGALFSLPFRFLPWPWWVVVAMLFAWWVYLVRRRGGDYRPWLWPWWSC
jgi:hypothetical protein